MKQLHHLMSSYMADSKVGFALLAISLYTTRAHGIIVN